MAALSALRTCRLLFPVLTTLPTSNTMSPFLYLTAQDATKFFGWQKLRVKSINSKTEEVV